MYQSIKMYCCVVYVHECECVRVCVCAHARVHACVLVCVFVCMLWLAIPSL